MVGSFAEGVREEAKEKSPLRHFEYNVLAICEVPRWGICNIGVYTSRQEKN